MNSESADPSNRVLGTGVRLSKGQVPMIDNHIQTESSYHGGAVSKASLNSEWRKREYNRIVKENMSILKRIECRKPVYSRSKWARDRKVVEGYLRNIKNDGTTG